MNERRTSAHELRAEGRQLRGTVLDYGDTSSSHRERFEPGAIMLSDAVHLDLFHDAEKAVAWHPGGGLSVSLDADAVRLVAELPPIPAADKALAQVRAGEANGLSLEFRSLEEHRAAGLRVITSAVMVGCGIVRRPSYERSRVEARARSGLTLAATIPSGTRLSCECSGPDCDSAEFADGIVEAMLDIAFEAEQNLVAAWGNYSSPLASTSRGTLRRDGPEGFAIDLPDDPVGQAVKAADESTGIVVRPFLDPARSPGNKVGSTMVYEQPPALRALIVSATDKRSGWPTPAIRTTSDRILALSRLSRRSERTLCL